MQATKYGHSSLSLTHSTAETRRLSSSFRGPPISHLLLTSHEGDVVWKSFAPWLPLSRVASRSGSPNTSPHLRTSRRVLQGATAHAHPWRRSAPYPPVGGGAGGFAWHTPTPRLPNAFPGDAQLRPQGPRVLIRPSTLTVATTWSAPIAILDGRDLCRRRYPPSASSSASHPPSPWTHLTMCGIHCQSPSKGSFPATYFCLLRDSPLTHRIRRTPAKRHGFGESG